MSIFDWRNKENDYYQSTNFLKHRKHVCGILEKIPAAESPKGWKYKDTIAIGGFEYLGFSDLSSILYVASSQGRGLIDLESGEIIARDPSTDYKIDERLLTCDGFEVLDGLEIKLADRYGASVLPISNSRHESLQRVSPLYPSEDIIFQPPFESCFSEGHNKNCVRVYRGFLYCYAFSFCGDYFVIADDGGIAYWEAQHTD